MSVRPLTLPVLLLLLGVCLVRLIHQYCDCFTPLASWILFLVFSLVLTLVSYFVYVVIFCRSQFVPAPSVHVLFYFQIGLSLARVFLFPSLPLHIILFCGLWSCSNYTTAQPQIVFWLPFHTVQPCCFDCFTFVHFGWSCIVCYFVIFCLLSVCSSTILACFILFHIGLSLACVFFQVYSYRLFSFVDYDRAPT